MPASCREKVKHFCKSCNKDTVFTAEVAGLFIDSIHLPEPYPLIPEDHLRLCSEPDCGSLWTFVEKSILAFPFTENLKDQWSKALILFKDFSGAQLTPKRGESSIGSA